MADGQNESPAREIHITIADLASYRAQDAKTICARQIEAVAKITDQLNHTPQEAAIFRPWCAAMRSHHASLRDAIKAVGDYWNPIQPLDQASLDAKDIGYNEALAAIDIHAGWPEFPGWDAAPVSEPVSVEPEHHFADLMLADETIDDAKARLSARLKELRHYLMAPEIRVNEDGSLGLTGEEQSELQDLERRQTLGRWLDA